MIFKFFLVIFIFFFFFNGNLNQKSILGKAKIIDGDTIHIGINKIRLHGIDAPEQDQNCMLNNKKWECGKQSSIFLSKLIENKNIICNIKDIDKYKRLIAVCFLDSLNINKFIVKSGWAIAYRYYSMDYVDDEEIAKKNKLGIWSSKFDEPYIHRKKSK